jgi:hypothetical protein
VPLLTDAVKYLLGTGKLAVHRLSKQRDETGHSVPAGCHSLWSLCCHERQQYLLRHQLLWIYWVTSLDNARLKIDRARNHISELGALVRSLPDLYISSIESDPQGRGNSIRYFLPNSLQLNSTIALIVGDAIHNLRTSLDYSWIAASDGEDRGKHAKFPVCGSAKELDGRLRAAQIDITHPALFELMISEIKPFKSAEWHIWALHELDIVDKHRLILPVVKSTTISGIVVEDEHGPVSGDSWPIIASGDTFHFDFKPNIQIKNKGKPTVEVRFADGVPTESSAILTTLEEFSRLVARLVDLLERVVQHT